MGRSFRTHLRRLWWKAKGWPNPWPPGAGPSTFRPFPTRCGLCGRLENPLIDEMFIAVHGEIIRGTPGYDFYYGWYCKQLNLVRPTGYVIPHHRHVCRRHGRFMRRSLTDCLTGVEHTLLPQPGPVVTWLSNAFHEAGYWLHATARFLWLCLREVVSAVLHPVHYYKWVVGKSRKGNKQ